MGVHQLPSNLSMEKTASYTSDLYTDFLNKTATLEAHLPVSKSRLATSKRALDLFVVAITAPITAPLIFAVGLAIWLTSPGPIFYRHNRVLRKYKSFEMLKFRTMCCGAEEALEKHLQEHPEDRDEWDQTHKLKNDPRITTIGRFLRKTSLDELPQLWHVWRGEMSLVGPRPIVTAEIAKYGEDFVYYTAVKPGIAGLWQASGRSQLSYAERVALDRRYAEQWSLWLDVKILFRTLFAVVRTHGAF